jgi:4-amino-4-deoxy-L-arabinose transferase-like glycosyltransferase
VILPLWGWVRRQFDDRVALVTCFLYIIHPKFIEWSPEVLRDPTFWFFLVLTIYCLWRAVTEVRYGYFTAGGMSLILASLARVEGFFLLIPLALWVFWRFRSLQTDRKKLVIGVVLCVVVLPALLAAANFLFLSSRSGWGAMRLNPFGRGVVWLSSLMGRTPADAYSGAPGPSLTLGRMLWVFFPVLTRGLSPVYALLMFGGLWRWRRVWARRDHQPLFYVALCIMCGIWVQLWYDRGTCPRYALPIVLMASPFAALGLLWLIDRVLWVADRLRWGGRARNAIVVGIVAAIAVGNLIDAMTGNAAWLQSRQTVADLGRWVHNKYPKPPKTVGPAGFTPIVCFYSESPYQMFRSDASDAAIIETIKRSEASLVLLEPIPPLTPERCNALGARLRNGGFDSIDPGDLPTTCKGIRILVPKKSGKPAGLSKP